MTLFHGSTEIIKNPQFGNGKPTNDYGRGFYCTLEKELAKEWACQNNTDGFANEYFIDETKIKILNLTKSGFSVLNWLAILLENRNFNLTPVPEAAKQFLLEKYSTDYKNYDAIIGYRANDSYFTFATNFLNNIISLSQLEQAMKLGDLGLQFVLKSETSFNFLTFNHAHDAKKETYYKKFTDRDTCARNMYKKFRENIDIDGTYILDIMRNTSKQNARREN